MKKLILIFTMIFVLGTFLAFADDGGSYYPEDWSYGNIYVKEPNDKIALKKELLVVEQMNIYRSAKIRGSEITALFGFKNTTKEAVTVPCAFPVVLTTQFAVKKDETVSNYIYIGNGIFSDNSALAIALQKDVYEIKDNNQLNVTKSELFALDKKLATVSASEYIKNLSRFGINDRIYKPIEIYQDKKKVPILTVGIETTIEKNEELNELVYREQEFYKYDEIYTLKLVLHFYHELHFAPNASSSLRVRYDINTKKRDYHGSEYAVRYDISTGGTWKGAIEDFLVLTDSEMEANNSKTTFDITPLGEISESGVEFVLYAAKNYKPQQNEYFDFKTKSPYREDLFFVKADADAQQDFVTQIRSSSTLSGTFKMAGNQNLYWDNWDEADKDENLRSSTYAAETSFDGILYNGWVEGVKGDGIGEWIEFTLTKSALGPFATNGLRRFANLDSTWLSNNRVRSMTLLKSSGKEKAIVNFADLFPKFSNWFSSQRIAVNAVRNPLFLEKGTYRLRLDSVYKGTKWDDTVLGEVWFIPLSGLASEIIFSDKSGLFQNELNKIVQEYVSHYVSRLEDDMRRDKESSEK
ncbi:MAG: hypothetical protein J5817_07485 [Treponema sp.]|nr:hypothetical protein [Treponema sp.]